MSVQPKQALNLDSSQQLSFIRYHRTLPEKPPTTIRIFNRSDYYTVHGNDARFCSMLLFNTPDRVKVMGADKQTLEYMVMSKAIFERLARELLLVKQYRAEVYVNQGASKLNQNWQLEYKGSPGNLAQFEDILYDNTDIVCNSCVMAIKLGKNNSVGISCVDMNEHTFSVAEFSDNQFYSEVESIIVQMSPRECVLQQTAPDERDNIKKVIERCGTLCTVQKKMEYNIDTIAQDLNRLLHFSKKQQKNCHSFREVAMELAMAGLHSVIQYLDLLADDTNFGQFKLKVLDIKNYVHLDGAAVTALNILPGPNVLAHKKSSILGMLDCCRTPQGKRLVAQWIKQPLRDINTINDRLDVVEALVNDQSLRHVLYNDLLRRMPDLLILSRRVIRKRAKLQDCFRIYQAIDKLPYVVSKLREANNKTIDAMFVNLLSEFLGDMQKYQQMIETTVDMDQVQKYEFLIKPSYDDELTELDATKKQLEEKIQAEFRNVARTLDLDAGKTIKLENSDNLGYHMRVTLKEERALNKKEFKVLSSVKGGVRFHSLKMEKLNEAYRETVESYEQQQKTVVTEILGVAAGYKETLNNISHIIAQLDVLVSFAEVSSSAPIPYVRPKLFPEGSRRLKLTQVRHPCIETQDSISFHPNDIEFDEAHLMYVVTGPNMGGKSTYIRSVGVAVLMAQIGCFVACADAEISIVDSILARIGATDCMAKGLSTFMVEMVETAGILRTATDKSLVIIDELGRGTSTYEGCGIAWAIVEHLVQEVKSFTMFATHFHEIMQLADEIPTVHNKHVTAVVEEGKLVLLYQVKPGGCDKSFGLHIAKMVGMDDAFIADAKSMQDKLEDYRNMDELMDLDCATRQNFIIEGDKIIEEYLEKWEDMKRKGLSDAEEEAVLKKLKVEMRERGNPYINGLFAGKAVCSSSPNVPLPDECDKGETVECPQDCATLS